MSNLVKWWFGGKYFPDAQLERILLYKPDGFPNVVKNVFRTWIIHPIKRRLAKYWVALLQTIFGLKVVGITGSAGKTTTKELVASILRQKGKTVASFANIDPVFNIPTTILKCSPSTRFLVLEMGVEFPGEMDFYLWLAKPDVGVITNIFPTHLEFFGSVQGVFKEKSKLVKKLNSTATAVLNSQNDYLRKLGRNVKCRVSWFTGENEDAAAEAGKAIGISEEKIQKGIAKYHPPEHRMKQIRHRSGAMIIDDTYNNNPEAAKRAIKLFNNIAGKRKKVIVFGDMLELGKFADKYHRELGKVIAKSGTQFLIGVGPASKVLVMEAKRKMGKDAIWVEKSTDVLADLKQYLKSGHAILIKGSRSIGLDKLVDKIV